MKYELLASHNCIIPMLCHSPIQYVVMTRVELADKLYQSMSLLLCFLCFPKEWVGMGTRRTTAFIFA